jgi:hypothetical protein
MRDHYRNGTIEVWMTGDAFARVGLQSPTSNK